MTNSIELAMRTVILGVGATLTMDAWAFVLRRFGVPSLDLALLGRWVGHLRRGQWRHERIAEAPPIPGERSLGWLAHYGIGVTFAGVLLATSGAEWARSPTLGPALIVGLVTVAAPLFILQPAFGAGIASSKTPRPVFNALKSVVTHTVFGLGLYLSARVAAGVVPQ